MMIVMNKIFLFLTLFCLSTILFSQEKKDTIYIHFDLKQNSKCLRKNFIAENLKFNQQDLKNHRYDLLSKIETNNKILFNLCNVIKFRYKKVPDVLPKVIDNYNKLELIQLKNKKELQNHTNFKTNYFIVEVLGSKKALLYEVSFVVDQSS